MNRREFIQVSAALAAGATTLSTWAEGESELIYLSPVKSNGELSRCQAEIWYVSDGNDLFVVTASDAWRTEAISRGLSKTQIWTGNVGQWQSSGGAYRDLPAHQARGFRIEDASEHERVLNIFGGKYSGEWGSWGPRFKNGLADGSRVMLRYRPLTQTL